MDTDGQHGWELRGPPRAGDSTRTATSQIWSPAVMHDHANSPVLVRIWDRDGRLVYAEVARTVPKHALLREQYTVTMPDSDLGIVPDGGSYDFQSLLPKEAT